jgi:UDP-N-acetylglucosamine--N-acetylmuramyl-(pentapeptide) pyrophosphoryl-undecaprenol N-acetylglucosamine transferase
MLNLFDAAFPCKRLGLIPMAECIVFTGGGTAGHVFPALAVLDELAPRWRGRVVWIGSSSGMERDILRRRAIPYYGIPTGKLRRYFSLANFLDLFRVLFGFLASLAVLSRERPRLVFSKGGYVTVPPLAAARLLGIPSITHESDLNPGLATRINARSAQRVLVSFAESAGYLPAALRAKVIHTGNPVRRALLGGEPAAGRALVGCPPERPLLLVLGGSLGSAFINGAVQRGLSELTSRCFVVHQMGSAHYRPASRPGYHAVAFLDAELPDLLAACDLVLCRAGANTLWELAALGKPAVLVPLSGQSSRGDQLENARHFAGQGAALVVPEEEEGRLVGEVLRLLGDRSRLAEMGRRARELGRPDAAARIAELVLERAR